MANTLVVLVEAENRAAMAATLREIARDIERGISNAGGGGAGEPQARMDWQIDQGAELDEMMDLLIRHYDSKPGVVVANHDWT